MKRWLIAALMVAGVLVMLRAAPAQANGGTIHIVREGETLFSIAATYGLDVQTVAGANRLTGDFRIYIGQSLIIPTQTFQPAVPAAVQPNRYSNPWAASPPVYSPPESYQAPSFSYNRPINVERTPPTFGQYQPQSGWTPVRVRQPTQPVYQARPQPQYYGYNSARPYSPYAPTPNMRSPYAPSSRTLIGEKWIDVNLTTQRLTAFEGKQPVFHAIVSTGMWQYPTIVGTFSIYVKYEQADMTGGYGADAYDLDDVPYVMYFHEGYGLHGTYWHNNFGTPMSHGCVNLPTPAAEWLFNWANVGTKVVTHY
ncbi:MAG: L,D-transpeptidase family protein [Anaerolineae bacterium]|nr:L,D-transpeptidase family protein [Anaerolineae bacterium]